MADVEASEAAFLSAMQSEAAGNYKANGTASEQKPEFTSSDEHDPAQAVPSPQNASQPTVLQTSAVDISQHDSLHSSSTLPLASNPTSAPPLGSAQVVDLQSESRSMSRATSDASINGNHTEMDPKTNGVLQHSTVPTGDIAPIGEKAEATNQDSSANPMSRPHISPSVDTAATRHVSTKPEEQGRKPCEAVQKDLSRAVPSLAAVIPDTGASSLGGPTDKPAETLPAPTMASTEPESKSSAATNLALPKARLPHDKIGILEDRIKEDPRGVTDVWLSLINEHRKRTKIEDARNVYERFLAVFPSAAEQWVAYAQMENDAQNRNGMEKIFHRSLMLLPYVPLWSMYLDHVRRLNNIITDTSGAARQTIHQAYDLALLQVGLDKESGKLWQDYVQFVKSGPGVVGGNGWQDQQKMDLLRKTYQRAICVPMQATNLLWKEYDLFEMGLNKMTGRKFLQDQSPAYMSARSSNVELQRITANLRRTTLPSLPPAMGFDGDVEYMEQLGIWKRWIHWEKDDPLVLKQEDIATYRARIVFVYKQAMMPMRFWPELWCDAADFCFHNDMEAEANEFLTQGIAANPESCLLAFKRADRIELTTANEEGDEAVKRRGTAVREPHDKVLDALYDLIQKCKTREQQGIAQIEAEFVANGDQQPNGTTREDDDDVPEDDVESKDKQRAERIDSIKNMNAVQMSLLSKTLSYVWIAVMRAMRRVQGKGKVNDPIGGLRGAFSDARKRGRITSDVYVACALLEFHCYEAETGRKIFERGLKLFPEDENFALEYIKHLVANNDHTNARVVFETAVTRLAQKPETVRKAKPLYAFFHDFESHYGELSQIMKLEKRMSDLFPEDPLLSLFSRRFIEQGFDPTAIRPIISPATQARPKVISSIETTPPSNPVQLNYVPPPKVSPKRPLPIDDSDNDAGRPHKIQRGESPLKGAAGRRLDQQKRNQQPQLPAQLESHPVPQPPPPPPLPREVTFLLSIIPKAETYHATKFKAEEMVRLIRETTIPTQTSHLPQQSAPRGPPPPQAQPMQPIPPMPQRPPMPQVPYGQYPPQFNGSYPQFSCVPPPSASALYTPASFGKSSAFHPPGALPPSSHGYDSAPRAPPGDRITTLYNCDYHTPFSMPQAMSNAVPTAYSHSPDMEIHIDKLSNDLDRLRRPS